MDKMIVDKNNLRQLISRVSIKKNISESVSSVVSKEEHHGAKKQTNFTDFHMENEPKTTRKKSHQGSEEGSKPGRSEVETRTAVHKKSHLYDMLNRKLLSRSDSSFKLASSSSDYEAEREDDDSREEDGGEYPDNYQERRNGEGEESRDDQDYVDNYDDNNDNSVNYHDHDSDDDDDYDDYIDEEKRRQLYKEELIERYVATQSRFRYIIKKNAYFQDKIYRICLRKGYFVEGVAADRLQKNKGDETNGRAREKVKRTKTHFKSKHTDEDDEEEEEDILVDKEQGRDDKEERGKQLFKNSKDEQNQGIINAAQSEHRSLVRTSKDDNNNNKNNSRVEGLRGFKLQVLAAKYIKTVRRIFEQQQSKTELVDRENILLQKLRDKQEETQQKCQRFFDNFMRQIRQRSQEAVHACTGRTRFLNSAETEAYITETTKLFDKLRETTLQFYVNWHGLKADLNELERSENAETEGLQSLEYEQLCAENYTLREKAEFSEGESVKERKKIAHSIQLYAHFKEKDYHLSKQIEASNAYIAFLNKRVKTLTQVMDAATDSYGALKEEQTELELQSDLIDNPRLMNDFEKTNYEIRNLKNQKTEVSKQVRHSEQELKLMHHKIHAIQRQKQHHPPIKRRGTKKSLASSKDNDSAPTERQQEIRKADEKQKKLDRLLQLLETQTAEPWKPVREELMVKDKYNQRNFCHQRISV